MKRFLLGSALALALANQASALTPTSLVNYSTSSGSTSYTTGAASAGCATGQVAVAAIGNVTQNPTSFKDSTDNNTASWTQVGLVNDHGVIAFYKRVVGATAISTSTTFTETNGAGSGGVIINVYCVTDGVGAGALAGDGSFDAGATTTLSTNSPAPSAGTSYQFAAYGNNNAVISSYPASGSDASWQTALNSTAVTNFAMAVSWRQAAGAATIKGTAGAFSFGIISFAEVTTSGGGGATAKSQSMNLLGVQ